MLEIVKNAFKKLDNYSDKFLTIYLIINVIWVFLGISLCNYNAFSYQGISTSYVLFLILNIFIIIYFNFRGLAKFDKIDIFLVLLIIFGIIATVFAKDKNVSLYGCWKRYEGLFQLLYYYSLMYLSSKITNRKSIIIAILFFGFINAFISILQIFNILKFIPITHRGTVLAQGFLSNSNFLGSYMVLCLGISIGMFLYSTDKTIIAITKLILCCIFFIGLLASNALSGIVGFFGIIFFIIIYLVYLIIKKQIDKKIVIKYILLILSLISINAIMNNSHKTVINNDVKKLTIETKEISKGNYNDSYGNARMFIWKNTLKVIPKYLLHGVGIDNFTNAFGEYAIYTSDGENITYYDKAHSEYLQKLLCEGIFSFLTYIIMLFVIFVVSIKNILEKNNYITICLLLAFIGYCIQATFNISVIEVAPLFWINMGLLYEKKCKIMEG